jgi:YD repeat-containing protein
MIIPILCSNSIYQAKTWLLVSFLTATLTSNIYAQKEWSGKETMKSTKIRTVSVSDSFAVNDLFHGKLFDLTKPDMSSGSTFYRPQKVVYNDGYKKDYFTYDGQGRLLTLTNEYFGEFTNRYEYTYDASGNIIMHLYLKYANGAWQNYELTLIEYDANNLKTLYLLRKWINNEWVDSRKTDYTYNLDGYPLQITLSEWTSGSWKMLSRKTLTYNEFNSVLSELTELDHNGVWEYNYHHVSTYNAENRITSLLVKLWDNGAWLNETLNTMTYDSAGNKSTGLRQVWINGEWQNRTIYFYTYDTLGRVLTSLSQSWKNSSWVNSFFNDQEYNQNWGVSVSTDKIWVDSLGTWLNQNKSVTDFDLNGNAVLYDYETWSDSGWVSRDQRLRSFDPDNNLVMEVLKKRPETVWEIQWTKEFMFDPNGNCYFASAIDRSGQPTNSTLIINYNHGNNQMSYSVQKLTVEYQSFTGVNDAEEGKISFHLAQNYPNPFNPETVIRFSIPETGYVKGVVYDILGREVRTLLNGEMNPGNHEVKVDAAGLSSGVYFFRIEAGKYSSAIKMIVNK